MEFFSEKVLNEATDLGMARVKVPGILESLEAAADLRQQYRQDGTEGRMGDWRHVATIRGPVLQVAEALDSDFLNRNGKRDFYRWLTDHPEWCAYDRRRNAKRSDMVTFVDGKEV